MLNDVTPLLSQIGCFQKTPVCALKGKTLYPVLADLGGQPVPPEPTLGGGDPALEHKLRTYNIDNSSKLGDWTRWMPWRSPGKQGKPKNRERYGGEVRRQFESREACKVGRRCTGAREARVDRNLTFIERKKRREKKNKKRSTYFLMGCTFAYLYPSPTLLPFHILPLCFRLDWLWQRTIPTVRHQLRGEFSFYYAY